MNLNFDILIAPIDLGKLNTDADFEKEAQGRVMDALVKIGEKLAEETWDKSVKQLRGLPGLKVNASSTERRKHIREGGMKYSQSATIEDRLEVKDYIVARLKEMKKEAK